MPLLLDSNLNTETELLIETVIGAVIEVHRELGPGYLEKVYESAMAVELNLRNISYEVQIPVSVIYKGVKVQRFVNTWI